MQASVALGQRGRLAALFNNILHRASRSPHSERPDPRNLKTFRQTVLGVLVKRSTRLMQLAQVASELRKVSSVKSAVEALRYFLDKAAFPMECFATKLLVAALRRLEPEDLVTYRGKAVVVIDPTDYPKRSRGKGKRGRHMQYIGRVRKSADKAKRVATTFGYRDVWAGLILKGKQVLPLGRQLYSNAHPKILGQNQVEEVVLYHALGLLEQVGLQAIVVADRGLGRKELLIQMANAGRDFVIRIDPDILVQPIGRATEVLLGNLLQEAPVLGEGTWDRGQEGKMSCLVRSVRATIRFSRSGRKGDFEEGTLTFVQLIPVGGVREPLVLATTLPVHRLVDANAIARLYSLRRRIDTGFETMKGWGLGNFMVRSWQAIERLLWVVAIAYALLALALKSPKHLRFCLEAQTLLKRLSVLGRRLTVGKLAEAIGLDYTRNTGSWIALWS